MTPAHILRFPRSDSQGGFVVIQATPIRSKALDFKLVGTDGVEPYAVSLSQERAAALRVKNSPCTDDEWISILTAVLQQEPASDIEVLADVENEAVLTLTVRRKGKEFTQRLGAIELSHSPHELIELFDWCAVSAQMANEAKEALASATAKASRLEESVHELKAQLDGLLAAKEADESELLEKFRDLLNEKKVKIRQQQKLLAAASVEPDKLAQVQSSQAAGTGHAATKSRPAKRKTAPGPINEEDSSSDEGFEKMDVEQAPEDSGQQRDTTEDEDETASEDDDDDQPAAPTSKKQHESVEASQPKGQATAAQKEAPPVKRELPFAKKKAAPKAPPRPTESETESDDEL
ncbi:hypothetical protein LX32DRAFT_208136 [Colletotrichum zoysiae]|uniref:XRCC4 coiled-coil domain-containing protein n=1 Tax=Colletotrichum zoysiae TaxID=1216348 RepID=A0AAD9M2Z7_9PEZI|nr:hypothetical protein LX32DRAFT_208136 [Colletotrichum zoysiae]